MWALFVNLLAPSSRHGHVPACLGVFSSSACYHGPQAALGGLCLASVSFFLVSTSSLLHDPFPLAPAPIPLPAVIFSRHHMCDSAFPHYIHDGSSGAAPMTLPFAFPLSLPCGSHTNSHTLDRSRHWPAHTQLSSSTAPGQSFHF